MGGRYAECPHAHIHLALYCAGYVYEWCRNVSAIGCREVKLVLE